MLTRNDSIILGQHVDVNKALDLLKMFQEAGKEKIDVWTILDESAPKIKSFATLEAKLEQLAGNHETCNVSEFSNWMKVSRSTVYTWRNNRLLTVTAFLLKCGSLAARANGAEGVRETVAGLSGHSLTAKGGNRGCWSGCLGGGSDGDQTDRRASTFSLINAGIGRTLDRGTIGPYIPIGLHPFTDAYSHLSTLSTSGRSGHGGHGGQRFFFF